MTSSPAPFGKGENKSGKAASHQGSSLHVHFAKVDLVHPAGKFGLRFNSGESFGGIWTENLFCVGWRQ